MTIQRLVIFGIFSCLVLPGIICRQSVDAQDELQNAVEEAVEFVNESVVQIETIGGLDRVGETQTNDGPTTGTVVSADGYIVSSSLNFIQKPSSVFVRGADGKRMPAEIVGRDESRKLVLLKVKSENELVVPKTVSRDELEVGETAIALGKVYDPSSCNVSVGIVSATHRIWNRAVQTDAKISPNNFGGPLIDLKGRVIGILVPMSHREEGELAGVEWYDSGIGFAVPLDEFLNRIDQLKEGEDLLPGQLGVALKGSDIYADPATIAVCSGGSPADKAGLRTNDEIIAFDGSEITRQAQLKHAMGPLYAGDVVDIVVSRDGERLEFSVTLVAELEPFQPLQIGIIPSSNSMTVRQVIDDSGAAIAGIEPGDLITKLDDSKIESWEQLRLAIWNYKPDQIVSLTIERDSSSQLAQISLGAMSPIVQTDLEPAETPNPVGEVISVPIRISEFANKCHAIVPENIENASLLVWLPEPGAIDEAAMTKMWSQVCRDRNMIVLVPQSGDEKRWLPGETEFIEKAVGLLRRDHPIDPTRIAVGGRAAGAAMACLAAFDSRELFHGLIVLDSPFPTKFDSAETSAVNPLMIFVGTSTTFKKQDPLNEDIERLTEAYFPVHIETEGGMEIQPWVGMLSNWVDSLNRL